MSDGLSDAARGNCWPIRPLRRNEKMKEARSHKLGRKIAENILETANLFYQNNTKANFFRGIVRGLITHKWIREIIREEPEFKFDQSKETSDGE